MDEKNARVCLSETDLFSGKRWAQCSRSSTKVLAQSGIHLEIDVIRMLKLGLLVSNPWNSETCESH